MPSSRSSRSSKSSKSGSTSDVIELRCDDILEKESQKKRAEDARKLIVTPPPMENPHSAWAVRIYGKSRHKKKHQERERGEQQRGVDAYGSQVSGISASSSEASLARIRQYQVDEEEIIIGVNINDVEAEVDMISDDGRPGGRNKGKQKNLQMIPSNTSSKPGSQASAVMIHQKFGEGPGDRLVTTRIQEGEENDDAESKTETLNEVYLEALRTIEITAEEQKQHKRGTGTRKEIVEELPLEFAEMRVQESAVDESALLDDIIANIDIEKDLQSKSTEPPSTPAFVVNIHDYDQEKSQRGSTFADLDNEKQMEILRGLETNESKDIVPVGDRPLSWTGSNRSRKSSNSSQSRSRKNSESKQSRSRKNSENSEGSKRKIKLRLSHEIHDFFDDSQVPQVDQEAIFTPGKLSFKKDRERKTSAPNEIAYRSEHQDPNLIHRRSESAGVLRSRKTSTQSTGDGGSRSRQISTTEDQSQINELTVTKIEERDSNREQSQEMAITCATVQNQESALPEASFNFPSDGVEFDATLCDLDNVIKVMESNAKEEPVENKITIKESSIKPAKQKEQLQKPSPTPVIRRKSPQPTRKDSTTILQNDIIPNNWGEDGGVVAVNPYRTSTSVTSVVSTASMNQVTTAPFRIKAKAVSNRKVVQEVPDPRLSSWQDEKELRYDQYQYYKHPRLEKLNQSCVQGEIVDHSPPSRSGSFSGGSLVSSPVHSPLQSPIPQPKSRMLHPHQKRQQNQQSNQQTNQRQQIQEEIQAQQVVSSLESAPSCESFDSSSPFTPSSKRAAAKYSAQQGGLNAALHQQLQQKMAHHQRQQKKLEERRVLDNSNGNVSDRCSSKEKVHDSSTNHLSPEEGKSPSGSQLSVGKIRVRPLSSSNSPQRSRKTSDQTHALPTPYSNQLSTQKELLSSPKQPTRRHSETTISQSEKNELQTRQMTGDKSLSMEYKIHKNNHEDTIKEDQEDTNKQKGSKGHRRTGSTVKGTIEFSASPAENQDGSFEVTTITQPVME